MRFTEMDRRQLIQKIKRVKDPRERDRIIWALAGQEQDFFRNVPQTVPLRSAPRRPEPDRPAPGKPAPGKAPDLRNMPQITIDTRRLLGFVVPGFFAVFGLVRIGQAVLNYMASQDIEAEIQGLITGGIFLILGLVGIFRAMQPPQIKQDEAS